jgi:anti-sigma factor RsiW
MSCPEIARTQAYFDGELAAAAAVEVERHAVTCPECGALLTNLDEMRTWLREMTPGRAPAALHARILRALDREAPGQRTTLRPATWRPRAGSYWWGAVSGAVIMGLVGAIALFVIAPQLPLVSSNTLLDEVVAAHIRSMMPGHLIDVESTDQHTVKPWFAGNADVSPTVIDLSAKGFPLVGGRADYLDHQRSAAVVYEHGPHIINIFSWAAANPMPATATRNGYKVDCWRVRDLQYCAVSDTGWDELTKLVELVQKASAEP